MAAGYSPNPIYKKLVLKEGIREKLIHPPGNYSNLIGEILDRLQRVESTGTELDFVHFFPKSIAELEKALPDLKKEIKKNGMIWISWYKTSSGKKTELTENIVRDTALAVGLVDVKVCAIDEDWSGLKLVIRLKDR
jgi:hypothetical protein